MHKHTWISVLIVGLIAGLVTAATFTDVDTAKYHGKTGLKALTTVLDANFALIESGGTIDGNYDTLTINNTLTAISTNDATTNVVITVNGAVDGETIADDTIDDDSIDFADVTGADLTLTDCTAITASGDITANGNLVGDGSTIITNMASIFIGSSVGISQVVTNSSATSTNILTFTGGILTAVTLNP